MKITPEMMAKFEQCKSAEEVLTLAKKNNFVITKEQAQKALDLFQAEELTDEEMAKITGGESFLDKEWFPCTCNDRA